MDAEWRAACDPRPIRDRIATGEGSYTSIALSTYGVFEYLSALLGSATVLVTAIGGNDPIGLSRLMAQLTYRHAMVG